MKINCQVIVPYIGSIDPFCEQSLNILERRGYNIHRVTGVSDIARGRSILASEALAQGFEEIMWIDSDIRFLPDQVDMLRSHGKEIIGGVYVRKGASGLSICLFNKTENITFGKEGGMKEVQYSGAGFLLTQREVYERMGGDLPDFHYDGGKKAKHYFQHVYAAGNDGENLILGEDYSFCDRATDEGYKIYVDSSIRLGHVGSYAWSWDDLGERKATESKTITVNRP